MDTNPSPKPKTGKVEYRVPIKNKNKCTVYCVLYTTEPGRTGEKNKPCTTKRQAGRNSVQSKKSASSY